MFADRIVAARGSYSDQVSCRSIGRLAERIERAECFVLDRDAQDAIASVARSKPSSLLAALPLCRLPFKTCWFEWPGDLWDRAPTWNDSDKPWNVEVNSNSDPTPKWMGALVEAFDDTHQRVGITLAWEHDPRNDDELSAGVLPICVCPMGWLCDWSGEFAFSEISKVRNKRDFSGVEDENELAALHRLADSMVLTESPIAVELIELAKKTETGRELLKKSVHDAQGEYKIVMAMLCALNSTNCVEVEKSDLTRLNKSRARRGGRQFLSYSTVKIALSQKDKETVKRLGFTREQIRRHIVRGHFKVRDSGIYWWRPHLRGNPEHGQIKHQSYQFAA